MDKDSVVGSPKQPNGVATANDRKATGVAKPDADEKADQAEDKAQHDAGADDAVRDALATSAAAMTLGLH
jgi:hypothetical protein